MSYTIRNLGDVEDQAPKFGYAEMGESRFAGRDLDAEQTGLAFHRLNPGRRQAFAHRHDEAEEIYVVIRGRGRAKLDEDVVDLKALDAVRIAPPVVRAFEAGDDGLELLVFGPHHEKDGELIHEDVWASGGA